MEGTGPRAVRTLSMCLLLWLPLQVHAQWLRAESEHVVVYADTDEAKLRTFTRRIERFHALLATLIPGHSEARGGVPVAKLPMYLVRDHEQLVAAMPGLAPSIYGVFVPSVYGVQMVGIAPSPNAGFAQLVVLHEYAHHFMHAYSRSSYPPWLVEGFAEFVATAEVDDAIVTVGKAYAGRLDWVENARMMNLPRLLTAHAAELTPQQAGMFYAQSWLLTHYFMSDPERYRKLLEYLRATRAGEQPEAAFERVMGRSADTMRTELLHYLAFKARYRALDARLPEPAIEVTAMPASADALLLPMVSVRADRTDESALALLRAGPARFPGDPLALEGGVLADTFRDDDWPTDPKRAVALIEPWLGERASANQLYLGGRAYTALARSLQAAGAPHDAERIAAAARARALFARAHTLDPSDFRPLYEYVEASELRDVPWNASMTNSIVQAANLASRVAPVSVRAATVLMREGRGREARPLLQRLAETPHGGYAAGVGEALLALIDASGDTPPTQAQIDAAIKSVTRDEGGE